MYLNYNWITKYGSEYYKDTLNKLPKDPEVYKQLKEYCSQYRRFGIVIPMFGPKSLNKKNPVNELWSNMVLIMREYQDYFDFIPNEPGFSITIYVNSLSFANKLMTLLTNFLLDHDDAPAKVQQIRKDLAKVIKRLKRLEAKLNKSNQK